MAWWNDYVGLPFSWQGYDHAGVSCWGLVVLVYREVFGVELPRHDELVRSAQTETGDPAPWLEASRWRPVADPVCGDVLHMWGAFEGKRRPMHCGVITEPGRVLHAEAATGAVISRYEGDNRFLRRAIGAYRWHSI